MKWLFVSISVVFSVNIANAYPFYVEVKDGVFERCGRLEYNKKLKEYRLKNCEPIAMLLHPTPVITAKPPTPRPSNTPFPTNTPRRTETDPCPGGCMEWDPVADIVICKKPCSY